MDAKERFPPSATSIVATPLHAELAPFRSISPPIGFPPLAEINGSSPIRESNKGINQKRSPFFISFGVEHCHSPQGFALNRNNTPAMEHIHAGVTAIDLFGPDGAFFYSADAVKSAPLGASTTMVCPGRISPAISLRATRVSTLDCSTRFMGRAPYTGS